MTYPYLTWIVIFVVAPSIVLWVQNGNYLRKHLRIFATIAACAFLWGLSFDLVGSPLLGIWSYQHDLGIHFLRLPLEEYILLLTLAQELTALFLVVRKKIYG